MQKEKLYLLLGSNLGNQLEILKFALNKLQVVGKELARSKFYKTAPWGKKDTPSYVNILVVFETSMQAMDLLFFCQEIEAEAGRKRFETWEARSLDIDLIAFGNQIWHTNHLILPHPLLAQRRFVLSLLHAVEPQWLHPVLQQSAEALLAVCTDNLEVFEIENES